ncbi:hypothetical protein [Embleya sp. NPDC020630]|uniref:hypothetical protein n=1 Tax=Embleya sp. NPDC020630 TaxID=3363979 RepID=UPI00379A8675
MGAALGWLCVADDPIPDELRVMLAATVTDELARVMAPIPWMYMIDSTGRGSSRCLERLLAATPPPAPFREP